ncbi:hypothetical protein J1N35_023008, partial [Gossypium stocksii]
DVVEIGDTRRKIRDVLKVEPLAALAMSQSSKIFKKTHFYPKGSVVPFQEETVSVHVKPWQREMGVLCKVVGLPSEFKVLKEMKRATLNMSYREGRQVKSQQNFKGQLGSS